MAKIIRQIHCQFGVININCEIINDNNDPYSPNYKRVVYASDENGKIVSTGRYETSLEILSDAEAKVRLDILDALADECEREIRRSFGTQSPATAT